jgi:hypothetical protein
MWTLPDELWAITVRQPYADALVAPDEHGLLSFDGLPVGVKPIENRWFFPSVVRPGDWLVIHSSLSSIGDLADWAFVRARWPRCPKKDEAVLGAMVGAVRLVEAVRHMDLHSGHARWATGPVCWRFDAAVRFPTPLRCRGAQGLWQVPHHAFSDRALIGEAISSALAAGALATTLSQQEPS